MSREAAGTVDNYDPVNMELSDDEGSESEAKRASPKRQKSEVQFSSSSKHERRESREEDKGKSESRKYDKYSRDEKRKDSYRRDRRDEKRDEKRDDKRDDKYRRDDRDDRDRRRDDRHRSDRHRDERRDSKRDSRKYDRRDTDRPERRSYDRHRFSSERRRDRSRSPTTRQPEEPTLSSGSGAASPTRNITFHAERKLAKLDSLGLSLNQNIATPTTAMPSSAASSSASVEGVEIPAYYNPNAINVVKYASQIQKRKLLWSGKKTETETIQKTWGNATFSQDTDGKVASKFMRLMGIKDAIKPGQEAPTSSGDEDKQKKLFSTLDQQYEVARQVTHTMRGVGLGFGSQRNF